MKSYLEMCVLVRCAFGPDTADVIARNWLYKHKHLWVEPASQARFLLPATEKKYLIAFELTLDGHVAPLIS